MPEAQKIELDDAVLSKLGRALAGKFETYKADRRNAEVQWIKNLNQMLGKYDSEEEQKLQPGQSRQYPKVTRVKIISMVSRLMSLLFPNAEKNWMLKPSKYPTVDEPTLTRIIDEWATSTDGDPQTLTEEKIRKLIIDATAEAARNMEVLIDDQLQDMGDVDSKSYTSLVRRLVFSGVLFGLGVIKGPMTLQYNAASYEFDKKLQRWVIKTAKRYRPYFEFVPIWDYFPDMSALSFEQMEGQFRRHRFSRQQLYRLSKRSDFFGDKIRQHLEKNAEGDYKPLQYESELQSLGDKSKTGIGKYEVIEWYGNVSGHELKAAGVDIDETKFKEDFRGTVWLLGETVIKANKDPFPDGTKTYHQFVFEEDEVHLTGSGLPPIVRDSQMAVASAARMLMDNSAAVSGPSAEFDLDLLAPGQDLTIRPFAVYEKEGDTTGRGRAVQEIKFDSHIDDLLKIIDVFKQFSDQETFVNPLTGGDISSMPSEGLRTQAGASMAFGSAALPFQDIVRNFDVTTTSVIGSLVQWNLIFNKSRKDIIGDMRPVARGATGLLAKEMRAFAIDNLINTMTEDEKDWIDDENLVKERFGSRDLPTETLLVDRETAMQRKEQRQKREAATFDLQKKLLEAQVARETNAALKDASQARKNLDNADVALFEAVLKALESGVNPDEVSTIVARAQEQISGDTQGSVPSEGQTGDQAAIGVPVAATG